MHKFDNFKLYLNASKRLPPPYFQGVVGKRRLEGHARPLCCTDWQAEDFFIDLAAEEDVVIGAEKSGEKIAVEVKTFAGFSEVEDFHNALGQYLLYSFALVKYESEREVFLSIPEDTFEEFLDDYFFYEALEYFKVKFVVFDPINKKILQWERWNSIKQS